MSYCQYHISFSRALKNGHWGIVIYSLIRNPCPSNHVEHIDRSSRVVWGLGICV